MYPLEHDGAIRAAARRHDLDPALVAAVIYAESRFDAAAPSRRTAPSGSCRCCPSTAAQIARETGGVAFVAADLEDPRVNVRYGCYYLRACSTSSAATAWRPSPPTTPAPARWATWLDAAARAGRRLCASPTSPTPRRAPTCAASSNARRVYRELYGDRLRRAS